MKPKLWHLAMLRTAAILTPKAGRAEWLAEWQAELWHAAGELHGACMTAFCLGAFKDAYWLRRAGLSPEHEFLFTDSASRCLLSLAVLGIGFLAVALLLPVPHRLLISHRGDELRKLTIVPVSSFLFACMLLRMMNLSAPEGYLRSVGARRGLFLAAKALLLLPVIFLSSLDLGSLGGTFSPVFFDIALVASMVAAKWMFADQRRRCPVCLRLLTNPVRIGEASRLLLESHGTEQMCLRGHGLLYTPEWPSIWPTRQSWTRLGPSWAGLFR